MILSFIFFMILFLGGIWLMGLAQSLEDFQAIVFVGGLLITSPVSYRHLTLPTNREV